MENHLQSKHYLYTSTSFPSYLNSIPSTSMEYTICFKYQLEVLVHHQCYQSLPQDCITEFFWSFSTRTCHQHVANADNHSYGRFECSTIEYLIQSLPPVGSGAIFPKFHFTNNYFISIIILQLQLTI